MYIYIYMCIYIYTCNDNIIWSVGWSSAAARDGAHREEHKQGPMTNM